jgi:hypothetical protein
VRYYLITRHFPITNFILNHFALNVHFKDERDFVLLFQSQKARRFGGGPGVPHP